MEELLIKLLQLKENELKTQNLAFTLKYERLRRGMTQEQFAKMLNITRASLSHYEKGRKPSPSKVKMMSEILNIDLAKHLA